MKPSTLALFLAVGLLSVPFAPASLAAGSGPDPPDPAFTSQMWGGVGGPGQRGWGFTSSLITNPGPVISVAPGESVSLTLNSVDTTHHWHLDYDGDNVSDAGEPASGDFLPSGTGTSYAFTATTTLGGYWYRCVIHGWATQRGRFYVNVTGGNQPPTIALTNPLTANPQRWTGASSHTITWTMSDPNDPVSTLVVYLNYTSSSGSGAIAGPLTGGTTSFNWPVPSIDASDVTVVSTVIDPGGLTSVSQEPVPVVDSQRPTVDAVTPQPGALEVSVDTAITIDFSEPMDEPNTEASLSFCRQPGCNPVALSVQGWSGTLLTVQPAAQLLRNTDYLMTVGASADDASDPGNPLGTAYMWTFTTVQDPPVVTITSPAGGERWSGGSTHTIAWTATDPTDPPASISLWVNYSATGNPPWTSVFTGTGSTSSSPFLLPTDDTSNAVIEVTAVDTVGGKTILVSPAFLVDSTPPTVDLTAPAQGEINVVRNANLLVTFSEPMDTLVTATRAVLGLQEVVSGTWISALLSWNPAGDVLTINPDAVLAASTEHRLFVNSSAEDASDPGNAMAVGFSMTFTTGTVSDTEAPVITHTPPAPVAVGTAVEIRVTVTDNVGVQGVWLNYTDVAGNSVNVTMTRVGTTNEYIANVPAQSSPGTVHYDVYAADTAGNGAKLADQHFGVEGTSAPPADYTLLLVLLAVVVVALALVAWLWRRRRKGAAEAEPETGTPGGPESP